MKKIKKYYLKIREFCKYTLKNKTKADKAIIWLNVRFKLVYILPILIGLFIYVAFHDVITEWLGESIAKKVFQHFKPNTITDIFWIVVVMVIIIRFVRNLFNNRIVSFNFTIFLGAIASIYYYELYNHNFIFFQLESLPSLKYFDVISFLLGSQLLLILLNRFTRISDHTEAGDGFYTDLPIKNIEDDSFNRDRRASELVEMLYNTTTSHSFAVGIKGKWGSGKTSFINMVKNHIDRESIIIEYNPWLSFNKASIIISFFSLLLNKLKPFNASLTKEVSKYIKLLSEITKDGFLSAITNNYESSFSSDIKSIYDNIDSCIGIINKKIFIFIDDLDRLQKDEIIEVLTLIRNSANFKNVIFIVPYDREYILNTLAAYFDNSDANYLDKIFQLEIELSIVDHSIIRINLADKLKKNIPEKYYMDLESIKHKGNSSAYPDLEAYITSMRDVNRFVNNFILHFQRFENEVSFEEYFTITMIRYKYFHVLDFFYRHKDDFLVITGMDLNIYGIKMTDIPEDKQVPESNSSKSNNKALESKKNISIFSETLKDEKLGLSEYNKKLIAGTLESIFKFNTVTHRHPKSITYVNYLYRYFAQEVFSFDISFREWDQVQTLPYLEKFQTMIGYIKDKGLRKEIYFRLCQIKVFNNQEEFQNHIRLLMELSMSRSDIEKTGEIDPSKIFINFGVLHEYLNVKSNNILKLYGNNIENLEKIIVYTLSNENDPYLFSSKFISYAINDKRLPYSLPVSDEKMLAINICHLKKYFAEHDDINDIAWELFISCLYKLQTDNAYPTISRNLDARIIIKRFFTRKRIEYFLENVAIKKWNSESLYSIDNRLILVFENYDNFYAFVNAYPKSEKVKEFNDFYKEFRRAGDNSYCEFTFKHLIIR